MNNTMLMHLTKPYPQQMVSQRGLVLLVTLLALIIMMLASVALIRSTDANLQIAGNMAFKRDLINQAERIIPKIQTVFKSGALKNVYARAIDSPGNNYYATILPANDSGIPNVLLAMDKTNANIISDTDSGVLIRYVIDRMCLAPGIATEPGRCILADNDKPVGGGQDVSEQQATSRPIYRFTLRITGPRNTEAFLQTTYSDS